MSVEKGSFRAFYSSLHFQRTLLLSSAKYFSCVKIKQIHIIFSIIYFPEIETKQRTKLQLAFNFTTLH